MSGITWDNVHNQDWYHDPVTDAAYTIKKMKEEHDHPSTYVVAGYMASGGILTILGLLGMALLVSIGLGLHTTAPLEGLEFPFALAILGGCFTYVGAKRAALPEKVEKDKKNGHRRLQLLIKEHYSELSERIERKNDDIDQLAKDFVANYLAALDQPSKN